MPSPSQVIITDPESGKDKTFNFDHAYWSHNNDQQFHTQDDLFNDLGNGCLDNAFQGYNYTLLAYGQTGSGKSYSMMGVPPVTSDQAGIIPRVSAGLFRRIDESKVR
ncbi:kinesin-like protein, partial [Kipferlia bialata]|eukprot:g16655.t1